MSIRLVARSGRRVSRWLPRWRCSPPGWPPSLRSGPERSLSAALPPSASSLTRCETGARGTGEVRVDPHTERLREVPTVQARLAAGEVTIPTYIHFITANELTPEQQTVRAAAGGRPGQGAQPRVLRSEQRQGIQHPVPLRAGARPASR